MKFAIRLLIVSTLALGPAACNRSDAPDQPVSANSEKSEPYRAPEKNARPADRSPAPAPATAPAPAPIPRSAPAPVDRTVATVTVPSGTALRVTLADMVSTDKNKESDPFTASLSEPIVIDGRVVADKGARVTGHLTKVDEPGKVQGRARLEMVLDEIQTSGTTHKISTEPFVAVASDNHKRDTTEIAGGAAVGAAIGAIAGGGKGAAIGAIIGGGTGTTAVLLTKGQQLELGAETKVNFVLSRELKLPVIRNAS